MLATLFLAQVFGLVLLVKGLFVLLRPKAARNLVNEIEKSKLAVYTAGMFAVVLGIFLVLLHNAWSSAPEVIVSLLVWLILLKGILAVFAPKSLIGFGKSFLKSDGEVRGVAIAVLMLAFYLLYIGFGF